MKFITTLRSDTNYPTFRLLAQVVVGLLYLVGIGAALIVTMGGNAGLSLIAIAALLMFLVLVHALYEATVMIADIADATVRMAAKSEAADPAANLEWERPAPPASGK